MNKLNHIFIISILFFYAGCQTNPDFSDVGIMIIEAESFELVNASVIGDANASAGKSVEILAEDSAGSLILNLPPGNYIVNTIMLSPEVDHTAIYIQFNEDEELRIYSMVYNRYAYCKKYLQFSVEMEGMQKISFKGDETGMKIDRFEIVQSEYWQEPQE